MLKFSLKRSREGFTLLELIVVLVILALLAAIAIPTFNSVLIKTKDQRSIFELQGVSREAVALSAFDGGTSQSGFLRTWLTSGKGSASASAGLYADGASALSSVAWKNNDNPLELGDSDLMSELGELSDEYKFFSVSPPNPGEELISMAMRSAHSDHCVFATFNASTGAAQGTAIKDWNGGSGTDSCRAANAISMVAGDEPTVVTLTAVEDQLTVAMNSSGEIDVLANDSGPGPLGIASLSAASNGEAYYEGGLVTYTPSKDFTGSDSVTYEVTDGVDVASATLTINVVDGTVPLPTECATATVPSIWFPLGTAETGDCLDGGSSSIGTPPTTEVNVVTSPPGEAPDALPLPGNPITPGEMGEVTSLTSFPHSSVSYPHFVFGTSDNGGVFWVKDTGVQGVNPQGCETPSDTSAGNCAAGWLFAPGTFDHPGAAITGQGPGHGDLRAEFNYDTMFISDRAGIWQVNVKDFVEGGTPELLISSAAFNYSDTFGMTGYACFDAAGAKVEGDCLWVLGDDTVRQVNINTKQVTSSSRLTGINYFTGSSIQPISFNGEAQFVISREDGSRARFNTQGVAQGGLASNPELGNGATTVVGAKVYHAGTGALTSSPLSSSGGPSQVTSRVVKSVLNGDGTRTFSWTYDEISPAAGWKLSILHQAVQFGDVLQESYTAAPGTRSVTISPAMEAAINGQTYGYRVELINLDNNAQVFLKAQTWLSLVTESTRGWDTSVVTPGNTTYTSSVVAERMLNNAVTALHSHGVPNQIYMGMEDGCVRKATGDTFYTLWCNSSSDGGTFEPIIKKVDFGPSWDDTERCEARLDGIYCGGEVTNTNTDEPSNPSYETAPMIKVSSVTDATRVESVLPKGNSYERNVCYTRSSAPSIVSCVDMAGSSIGNYTLPGSITSFAFAKEWGAVKIIARLSDGTAVYQDGQNNEVHKFNAQVEDVAFASYQGSAVPAILANGSLKFGINVGAEGWTDATGSAQGSITQVDMTPPGLNVVAGGALYSSSYYSSEGLIKVTDSGYSVTGALRNVGGGCAITASGLVCEENGTPRLVSSVSWDEFSPRSDTATISALWDSAEGVKYLVKSPAGIFSVVDSVS